MGVAQVWTSLRELFGNFQAPSCHHVIRLHVMGGSAWKTEQGYTKSSLLMCLSLSRVTRFTTRVSKTAITLATRTNTHAHTRPHTHTQNQRHFPANTLRYNPVIDMHTSDICGLRCIKGRYIISTSIAFDRLLSVFSFLFDTPLCS